MNETPPLLRAIQEKKVIPPLGWVGIGCGTLVIIAVVILTMLVGWCTRTVGNISDFQKNPEKAAAELMVKMNPDVEKVSEDDSRGEMTIRTKDGKEVTLRYKDISEGKFSYTDAEGNAGHFGQTDLSNVPAWVPRVPSTKAVLMSMQNSKSGNLSGLYSATSTDSTDVLDEFFKAEAGKLNFTESSRSTLSGNGVETRNLSYAGDGRKLNIILTGKPGEDVQVNVGYEEGN